MTPAGHYGAETKFPSRATLSSLGMFVSALGLCPSLGLPSPETLYLVVNLQKEDKTEAISPMILPKKLWLSDSATPMAPGFDRR